jgi:hypothetical protein
MAICPLCEKQNKKSPGTRAHEYLRELDTKRTFGGGKKNGFAEQDFQCLQCLAKFTHSTDRNDFGWTLWQG